MADKKAEDLPSVEKPSVCFASKDVAPSDAKAVSAVGCVLGSFDPCHAGHEHMVRTLLRSGCEHVFVLVPATHFEKQSPDAVSGASSMPFALRLQQLREVFAEEYAAGRVAVGLAYEVLFIRLHALLQRRFPNARVRLGMGNDTYECLLASEEYFERSGLAWGQEEAAQLQAVLKDVVVFARSPAATLLIRELAAPKDGETAHVLRDSQVVGFDALKQQLRSSGTHQLRSSTGDVMDLDRDQKGQENAKIQTGRLLRESGEEVIVRQVSNPGTEELSAELVGISSTAIRALVHKAATSAALESSLKGKVCPAVLDLIVKHQLYK